MDPKEHGSFLEIDKSLLRMESSVSIIFQFWVETSKWCRSLIEELASKGFMETSVKLNVLALNWMIYQEAVRKAVASVVFTSQPPSTMIDILSTVKDMVSDEGLTMYLSS